MKVFKLQTSLALQPKPVAAIVYKQANLVVMSPPPIEVRLLATKTVLVPLSGIGLRLRQTKISVALKPAGAIISTRRAVLVSY
jgi:hypothetical protein